MCFRRASGARGGAADRRARGRREAALAGFLAEAGFLERGLLGTREVDDCAATDLIGGNLVGDDLLGRGDCLAHHGADAAEDAAGGWAAR